jgi:hypothetical protein
MKGKTTLVGILVLFGIFLGVVPTKVFALENCSTRGITIVSSNLTGPFSFTDPVQLNIRIGSSGTPGLVTGNSYRLFIRDGSLTRESPSQVMGASGQLEWLNFDSFASPGEHTLQLAGTGLSADGCRLGTYTVTVGGINCAYLRVSKDWNAAPSNGNECYANATSCVEAGIFGSNLLVVAKLTKPDGSPYTRPVIFTLHGPNNAGNDEAVSNFLSATQEYSHNGFSPNAEGTYTITVKLNEAGTTNPPICQGTFLQTNNCQSCITTPNDIAEQINDPYALEHHAYKICDQVSGSLMTPEGANAKDRCIACIGGDELGRAGIWTAVGCIPREPEKIVNSLLRLGLGMGGGFALIIILASGFVLSTSQGEPKRIEDAKGWLTSALAGMLFIIFSVTLLHFIGYSIFKIPGFGGP